MSFTLVTVSGTFLVTDDLTPARGEITFRLSSPMQDTGSNQIVSADRRSVRLDATGSFSIVLPANDDPTTQPTGVTYEVEELIEDSPRRSYAISLLAAQPSVNLADLAPAVPGPQLFQYALVGHMHLLDDLSDVFVPAPADAQVVTWVAANNRWESQPAGVSSHPNLATHDALGLATDAELAAHAGAADPHPTYETATEANAKIATHAGLADPHTGYATDADLATHAAAPDPHTGYQRESEKGAANGYASLDSGTVVPDAQIPAAIARDAEVTSAIATHAAAGDPHPTYETSAEAAAKVTAHEAAADPHTGYQRESEKGAAGGYASLDGSTTVPDAQIPAAIARDTEVTAAVAAHAAAGDPHPTYATDADLSGHAGAADPHTGYQKESEKGAASGYASLGADTLVPQDQLGTGTQDGTRFLRDDGTWQGVPAGYTDEQAQDAVGTMLLDTATIDLTYVDATPALSADIKPSSVSVAMLSFDPATQAELDAAKDATQAVFSATGTLTVRTGTSRFVAFRAMTIRGVRASVGTAPTGATVLVDVNKNGTTIFTTQGNRPSIAISGNISSIATPDVTTLAAGDYLTVDIDQIGSGVAGADLVVQIEVL